MPIVFFNFVYFLDLYTDFYFCSFLSRRNLFNWNNYRFVIVAFPCVSNCQIKIFIIFRLFNRNLNDRLRFLFIFFLVYLFHYYAFFRRFFFLDVCFLVIRGNLLNWNKRFVLSYSFDFEIKFFVISRRLFFTLFLPLYFFYNYAFSRRSLFLLFLFLFLFCLHFFYGNFINFLHRRASCSYFCNLYLTSDAFFRYGLLRFLPCRYLLYWNSISSIFSCLAWRWCYFFHLNLILPRRSQFFYLNFNFTFLLAFVLFHNNFWLKFFNLDFYHRTITSS